ncbi:hypothetical protein C3486_32345 [Streptomyces sp. Ru73]|uniref:hypothetical protein n=1 Tax=Streptomyces sp. Ru73 TaxID=2080748 RepID=UPI000CDD965A|nr:hypothetical protein [Streptomyces sp. Ru73]POX36699.1 hypothetical protein C3486_32345 [Streptomyces sp. Ru73]
MAEYDFPEDLIAAQLEMHRTRAAYRALCETLPWSVVPLPGYERPEGHHYPFRREDSPGYTEEQAEQEARLRARMRELSIQIGTHPFWDTLSGPDVVAARSALKHVHDTPADEADAAA